MMMDFDRAFEVLTGAPPLSWQKRLFREHFAQNKIPDVIDLPTGLGKTMVMAIWLIARAMNGNFSTRLIYVVDRRTVVDQATDLAEDFAYLLAPHNPEEDARTTRRNPILVERKQRYSIQLQELRQELNHGDDRLAISTLRGQLADNREWSRDPSRPAIIIGTVDLIGSALLFSGYRSSFKRRPLEAGLLGQDSLLVLDEAHLSKPFEKLLGSISDFQKSHGKPMRVIRMSATSDGSTNSMPFTLESDADGNLSGADAEDTIIAKRFNARKRLTIKPDVDPKKLNQALADSAIELAHSELLKGKRIVVFVRKPDDAREIAVMIRDHEKPGKSKSNPDPKGPYADSVEVLTGTMRGLERDGLVKKSVLKRFLDGNEDPDLDKNEPPVFLISTSAGEVGFDLNADHLAGDEAPLDSWIQRLGRVNRRGQGDAKIILVKASSPPDRTAFEKACIVSSNLLTDGMDVSPKALAAFRGRLAREKITEASSPKPAQVELTDILLDAWSMTSIRERMPGRPDVGPWLRGTDNEQAQTTIAWRAELELFRDDPSPEKALQAIFAKHPIRPHESLTLNTGYLLEFLKKIPKLKDRPENLMATRAAIRLPRGQVICRTLQQLTDDPSILYADSALILPATFGGLDSAGMLDAGSIPMKRNDNEPEPCSLDVADHEGYEQTDATRSRLRIVVKKSDGMWSAHSLPGCTPVPDDVISRLKPSYEKTTPLFDVFKRANFRVRLRQEVVFNDEDECIESLVLFAPSPKRTNNEDQSLTDHVGAVEVEAKRIVDERHLADDDSIRIALLFAAKWHDEGKKARVWQVFANNPDPDQPPRGKMAQSRDPKSLRGYRHEFGSVLRIKYPHREGTAGCVLPTDPDTRELALHLIATHHGAGRPHFGPGQYHPFTTTELDTAQTEVIRRFARLQQKYGWWQLAWLENLLRCADALASANAESTEIDEMEGVEQ